MEKDTIHTPTELTFGSLHIVVHSRFSQNTTETAADKAKKLILQHFLQYKNDEKSVQTLDNTSIQS